MPGGLLLAGIAVDPIHPGAGRAPGVVDLPVQRDPLGYPLILSSSVKGALKSLCARSTCRNSLDDRGFIECGRCTACCCLFGEDPKRGGPGETPEPSRLHVLDVIPIAYPAPSATHGYVYVAASPILRRASLLLESLAARGLGRATGMHQLFESLADSAEKAGRTTLIALKDSRVANTNTVDVGGIRFKVQHSGASASNPNLKPLEDLGGLAATIRERLVIAGPESGVQLVERSLLRMTRVALRRDRKTVAERMLWTEEYLPSGTLFITGILEGDLENKYCRQISSPINYLLNILGGRNTFYLSVGGDEAVGRGLIKFNVI